MSKFGRFMFAIGMLDCALSLLSGNHAAAIANLFMAVLWLYADDTQATAAHRKQSHD